MVDRAVKAGLASLVMGGAVWLANRMTLHWMATRGVPAGSALVEAARLAALVGGAALLYLAMLWFLGIPEVRQAVGLGRRGARAVWRRVRLRPGTASPR